MHKEKELFFFFEASQVFHERLPIALSVLLPPLSVSLFRSDATSRLRLGHGHATRRNRRRRARRREQARGFDANDVVGVVDRPSPIKAGFLSASPLCCSPDRPQRYARRMDLGTAPCDCCFGNRERGRRTKKSRLSIQLEDSIECFRLHLSLSLFLLLSQPRPRSSSKKKKTEQKTASSSSSVGGGSGGGKGIGGGNGGGGGGGGGGGAGGSNSGSSGDNSFLSFLSGLWPAYLSLLASQPLATKSATAAVLNAAGDASAQLLIEKKKGLSELDWARLGRFALLGAALVGPALHWWYGTLSRVVTLQGTAGALTRLGLDQLAFGPVFIGSFLAALGLLEGKSVPQVKQRLRDDLPTTVCSNWILWVPANFVNFRFVPVPLQVAFSNFVALFWNTYVSFVSNRVR